MNHDWSQYTANPGEIVEVDGYSGYFKVEMQYLELSLIHI